MRGGLERTGAAPTPERAGHLGEERVPDPVTASSVCFLPGNPGAPWACVAVDVHTCTTIFFVLIVVFIVIFIIGSIAICYFVSRRRTGWSESC